MTEDNNIQAMADEVLSLIGVTAQTGYMSRGSGEPIPNMITIRSGRLARSVLGVGAREREGIAEVREEGDNIIMTKGTTVPYAALHELGGIRPVTPNMRKFFWAKFYESSARDGEDNMSAETAKWFALTRATQLVYPPRPYLEPAIMEIKHDITNIIRKHIKEFLNVRIVQIVGGGE